jgi:hypothetical protein
VAVLVEAVALLVRGHLRVERVCAAQLLLGGGGRGVAVLAHTLGLDLQLLGLGRPLVRLGTDSSRLGLGRSSIWWSAAGSRSSAASTRRFSRCRERDITSATTIATTMTSNRIQTQASMAGYSSFRGCGSGSSRSPR